MFDHELCGGALLASNLGVNGCKRGIVMKLQGNSFPSIAQLQDRYLGTGRKNDATLAEGALSFRDILTKKTDVIQELER